jgi:hypothetical protein
VRGFWIRDYFKTSSNIWAALINMALAVDKLILLKEASSILSQLGSGE